METKDTIDFSCSGAHYPLTMRSPSINANAPLSRQYPEVLEHIMTKINQTLLSGGENCIFNKFAQIDGVKPMFFNTDGTPIPQTDTLYKILEISNKNTGFIMDRMRECALSVNGWSVNGLLPPQKQIDTFCQMAEIFAEGTRSDKFVEYTINGKDVKGFNKLHTMKTMEKNRQHQQW